MKKIKFATIGTSKITDKFLQAATECEQFEHYAVYSRNENTARDFLRRHEASACYISLEEMRRDPQIDAVYIASPNICHCAQAIHMLEAGKHVLCEKPLASNAAEVRAMLTAARKNHVILMEAMRSLSDPGMDVIRELLPTLGPIRRARFSFCQYSSRYDAFKSGSPCNIFSRDMSAGALMDIGIYCVEPLIALFGAPKHCFAASVPLRGGIDGSGTLLACYETMTAELIYSKIADSDAPSEIQGEAGTMYIDKIAAPHHIRIQYRNQTCETRDLNLPQNNMNFELQTMIRAILGTFDPTPLQEISLTSMTLLDNARRQIGLTFPAD